MNDRQNWKSLEPGMIGSMQLKNRFLFPSMCNFYCDAEGFVTPQLKAYVKARVDGGAAAIIMPGSPHGKPGPARPALSDDRYCAGWQELAALCHAGDCRLITQIHPAKAQAGRDPNLLLPDQMPLELIHELISSYAACAERARRAGVDGVEIHGAHAHEVAQFTSPYFNHRQDEYGGSVEKRCRFAVELIRAIKEKAGEDYPVIFRMSASELAEGGRELEESIQVAKLVADAGADAIHVSVGMPATEEYISAPMDVPDGFNLERIKAIQAEVPVPVVAVNRINTPELAEQVVADGTAAFVAVGRSMLADPDFVRKARTGETIRMCLGCNQGCKKALTKKQIYCVQNPMTGREAELVPPAEKDLAGKRILIVGAGVAGLEAANWFARRGADVEVWEKKEKAGGLMELAKVPPYKQVMDRMVDYRLSEAADLKVRIRYEKTATEENVAGYKPDLAILAIGSSPILPAIDGIHGETVISADELLQELGEGGTAAGGSYAVLGGGLVGLETADALAARGMHTAIFEMADTIGDGLNPNRMAFIRRRLKDTEMHPGTRVTRIDQHYVETDKGRFGPYDKIVVALGRRANCWQPVPGVETVCLGDADTPGTAMDAVTKAAIFALNYGKQN